MAIHLSPARLFIASGAAIAFGAWKFVEKRKRLKSWITTTAIVENVRRDRNGNVTIRVKYSDQSGTLQGCFLPFADGDRVGLGTEVSIAYNPCAPTQAFVADKKDMNITAIVSAVVGVGLAVAGTIALATP